VTDRRPDRHRGSRPGSGGRLGIALVVAALATVLTSGYLSAVRAVGEAPVCGPVAGCDTVAASSYATLLGIPVAFLGFGFALVLFGLALAWWRGGDRRALYALYGLGLLGVATVAYLTYLELFVIHAICVWCVSFAISVVTVWVLAVLTVRTTAA
jgi:uncharacterized membrane protein